MKQENRDFIKYLKEHPELRLGQAITNFSGFNYILGIKQEGENTYKMMLARNDAVTNGFKDIYYVESIKNIDGRKKYSRQGRL